MKSPQFKTSLDYEKANLLMQPVYIRVVDNIRKQAEINNWDISYQEINDPFPSYILTQKKGNTTKETNIWFICFQVCFTQFELEQNQPVEIDSNLISDRGELNWDEMEIKTQSIVKNLFDEI
ncbi:hypothetical protein IQ215_06175 [Cyanobacterium stanieri LEGE 03274]|uniref:Uncharacterized protein n=1 Tax=Cyanobacterium stanieri LEGE 03274 TaxID=1828756 RepID=A0ABR9V400_9CHRO|nr:hypothetical protein [Cyanobacterium stanieri]MBE9222279.1 hypothetical protein [Cyanobacterium stanieri LEGE 03274]